MSWYYIIQFYSIGFAFGFMAALAMNRRKTRNKGGYKKGVNDCRNCKNMVYVSDSGIVRCKVAKMFLASVPKACGNYQHIDDTEGES